MWCHVLFSIFRCPTLLYLGLADSGCIQRIIQNKPPMMSMIRCQNSNHQCVLLLIYIYIYSTIIVLIYHDILILKYHHALHTWIWYYLCIYIQYYIHIHVIMDIPTLVAHELSRWFVSAPHWFFHSRRSGVWLKPAPGEPRYPVSMKQIAPKFFVQVLTCWGASSSHGRSPIHPVSLFKITLWLFNIAMENGPFIVDLPLKKCHFPWLC